MDQFKDGDREVINGTTYVRQGGQWHPQSSTGPVYGVAKEPPPQTAAQATQDTLQVEKLRRDLTTPTTQNLPTGWERPAPDAPAQRIPGLPKTVTDPKSEGDAKLTVDERTAAFLATRVKGGMDDISRALAEHPGSEKPTVSGALGGIFGDAGRNYANSPARQRIENAQRDILDAALTLGTGAAYTAEQLEGYRQSYFPQLGDAPETIADKQLRLRRVLEAAKVKAGNAAPMIDAALANLGEASPPPQSGEQAPPAPTTTERGFGVKPDGGTPTQSGEDFRNQLFAAMRAKQIKSPADIQAFQDQYNKSHGTGWSVDIKNPETRRAIAAALSGKRFNIDSPKPDISDVRGGGNSNASDTINATTRGVPDVISSGLIDKVVAAGDTLFKGGPMDYNLARQYAISDYDTKHHPYARLAGQALGGFALPLGEVNSLANLTLKGAGYGAAYGAGSSRSLGDVPQNALLGGAAGAAVPLAFGGAGKLLSREAPKAVPDLVDPQTGQLNQPLEAMTPGQRVVRAEEYGINLPADAAGGRTAAVIGKGLDIMPGSAGVMEDARRATASQVGAASDVVASRFGQSRTMNEAGSELQRGAQERIARSETVTGKAYQAIPISDAAQASTSNSVATLQNLTGRFQSNPDLAAAVKDPKLATYLQALEKGGLSWKDLKDFRTIIGEKIGEMRFGESSSTSDLRALYAGLSEDMKATAASQGPKAVRAFERANSLYRNEQHIIENALTRILGKDGQLAPEKAAAAVQAMTKGGKSTGDLKTLAQIRAATVKSGAWDEIAATLIRLGGQPANSAGRDFNPQTFVHWYADMSEPARAMLFGKSELRKALDGFVAVNQRLQNVNALRNTSNTAGNLTAAGTVGTMAAAFANPMLGVKMLGVMAGNYGMAKAWTNPQFVRLITGYSKAVASGNQNAVRSQIGRLSQLATTNPELREPVEALLKRVANDNAPKMGTAVASPDGGPDEKKQPQR